MTKANFDGIENLHIQPIIIPRRVNSDRLTFFVVMSFVRERDGALHPMTQRNADPAEIPTCLRSSCTFKTPLGKSSSGYWPRYVQNLFQTGKCTLKIFKKCDDGNPVHSTSDIRFEMPKDLEYAKWTVDQADDLWRYLILPLAAKSAKCAESARRESMGIRFASFQAVSNSERFDDFDLTDFNGVTPNPWAASDLRPNLRLETINTRTVVNDIDDYVVKVATVEQHDDFEQLTKPDPDLVKFVELRDKTGNYAALFKTLQRGDNDPKFKNEILPNLKTTKEFQDAARQILAWRSEFVLGGSRGEFLRQTRFVESARHRSTDSNTRTGGLVIQHAALETTDDALSFEQSLAGLRHHPGIMRRLFLAIQCSIARPSSLPATMSRGAISLTVGAVDQPEPGFVLVPAKTLFDVDCAGSSPYFRPAPKNPATFYGTGTKASDAQQRQFRNYHALSTCLYLVSQEDPSQAMLRASQGVTDANQPSTSDARLVSAALLPGAPSSGASQNLTEPEKKQNDARMRMNAVNFYHRARNDAGDDISIAQALLVKANTEAKQLAAYNEHARQIYAANNPNGLIRHVAYSKLPAPAPDACHPLYTAESLMMGYSVLVQPIRNGGTNHWLSLNRRQGSLKLDNAPQESAEIRFEEEGFLATSAVIPPRPQTGTVSAANDSGLTFGLLDNNNVDSGVKQEIRYRPGPGQDPSVRTRFINSLASFDTKAQERNPRQGDMIIIAVEPNQNAKDGSLWADEVYVYPVLTAKKNGQHVLADQVKNGYFKQFSKPIVLDCENAQRADWHAQIIVIPHLTRLVDYLGHPIPPTYLAPATPPSAPAAAAPPFEHFTAETDLRHFAQTIDTAMTTPSADELKELGPTCRILTNLGPLNQVVASQIDGASTLSELRLPNLTGDKPGSEINPFADATQREKFTQKVLHLGEGKLTAVRGWVRKLGFVFCLNLSKTKDKAHENELKIKWLKQDTKPETGAPETWYVSQKLEAARHEGEKKKPLPISSLALVRASIPPDFTNATVIVRGAVQLSGNPLSIELTAEAIDIAVPSAKIVDSGSPLRWTLDLVRVGGGEIQAQFNIDALAPADPAERFVHPLDANKEFVEIISANAAPRMLVPGCPQRMFGTLTLFDKDKKAATLRFADGTNFLVDKLDTNSAALVGNTKLPVSGFFRIVSDSYPLADSTKTTVTWHEEPLRIAAEVSHIDVDKGQIDLTDYYGQTWKLFDQLNRRLPLSGINYSIRRFRDLVRGEWLIADCHFDPANEGLSILVIPSDDTSIAQAQTVLFGKLSVPPQPNTSRAAEGSDQYRPAEMQSVRGRKLPVWSNANRTLDQQTVTSWSQRMVVAETLTQYEKPKPAQAAGNAGRVTLHSVSYQQNGAAPQKPPKRVPRHLMISELIGRWTNWSISAPFPGQLDDDNVPTHPCKSHYSLTLSRPDLGENFQEGNPPFDRSHWLLPPLRFDRDYRFCLRRVDLAGNHLYDEDLLPEAPPHGDEFFQRIQTLQSDASNNNEAKSVDGKFHRATLPAAPIIAYTPDHLVPSLKAMPGQQTDNDEPRLSPKSAKTDIKRLASDFLCLTSWEREPTLVLLTNVLNPHQVHDADAVLEVLPPQLDPETAFLHGSLDMQPPESIARLVRLHERYLDNPADQRVFGRLRADNSLNYLPDPMAGSLSVFVVAPITDKKEADPAKADFFTVASDTSAYENSSSYIWPKACWVRVSLRGVRRQNRRGAKALPLRPPRRNSTDENIHVALYLPPGVTGQAIFSLRPPGLADAEYARMVRDHGSDTQTIKLIHATNGAWTRPIWNSLEEKSRDLQAFASPTRTFEGQLLIDKPTTGACSVTSYWNDAWDESLSAQHEPARAVVEINDNGVAVDCVVTHPGCGFGSEAVLLFDSVGMPYRKPSFKVVIRDWCLAELVPIDKGTGCNVLFRIVVTQAADCSQEGVRPASALAWHDEKGKLHIEILDRGACLGPHVDLAIAAERPPLPELKPELKNGAVASVSLVTPGIGRFTAPLHVTIIRRPPFYRIAEGRLTVNRGGGIESVEIIDGGGWYVNPPYCVVEDAEGDGFGADLVARLDEFGGVIGVTVRNPGRLYSQKTRIHFYNQLAEVPEQIIPEPSRDTLDDPSNYRFQLTFPDPHARRVDFYARAMSRFRQYLDEDQQSNGLHLELTDSGSAAARKHFPRLSAARQVEVASDVQPDKPEVEYVMYAYDWEVISPQNASKFDPVSYFVGRQRGKVEIRRTVRVRIYINRPWHQSGPEKLAVIVAPAELNTTLSASQPKLRQDDGGAVNPATTPSVETAQPGYLEEPNEGYAIDDSLRPNVSRWGYDPVYNEVAFPPLTADHFPLRRPELIYDQLVPSGTSGSGAIAYRRPIWIVLHDVFYDSVKELWYSDVLAAVGGVPGLPFIRFAVARYQQHGHPGKRLSPVNVDDKMMVKLRGRRELCIERHSQRQFTIRLSGEFDQINAGADFPIREVIVRLEARDPTLSPDVVSYFPPPTAKGPLRRTTAQLKTLFLQPTPRGDAYVGTIEFDDEEWDSAHRLSGSPSSAVLSIVEYEIFPSPESQSNSANEEPLIRKNRHCGHRIEFSYTLRLN